MKLFTRSKPSLRRAGQLAIREDSLACVLIISPVVATSVTDVNALTQSTVYGMVSQARSRAYRVRADSGCANSGLVLEAYRDGFPY